MSNKIVDVFGQKIVRGTVIAYPVRQGSDMWMSRAVVTSVKNGRLNVLTESRDNSTDSYDYRKTSVVAVDRVVVTGNNSKVAQRLLKAANV